MSKLAIRNFVRDYSIETTVHQASRIERFADIVTLGTRLYIAHPSGTSLQATVALAGRLRNEGMEPVPHVVARRIESLPILDDFIARLTGDAGVKQVLVVAGDQSVPHGEFESALQILESGVLHKHKVRCIGIAGHPEGHRDVAAQVLRDALARKNAYADRADADVYIITQMTFSPVPVIAWESSHGAEIGRLPITVGLPGLATAKTLLKYALDCGVGASLGAFRKRYASLTKLLTVSAPDSSIVALARHKARTPETQLAGVHFFPFGGLKKTADWANKIVAGDFEITEDGGLKVD